MEEFLRKYKIESVLIALSIVIAVTSLLLFINSGKEENNNQVLFEEKSSPSGKIFVDISGAVNKPGVYQLPNGSRLKDALAMAKGITDEASKDFFSRNYNLAKIMTDQEKIYIPSQSELQSGLFEVLSATEDQNQPPGLININAASADELDTLSGIGKVTAEKIIAGRPYQSVEELLTKKIVKKSVFEKIKDSVIVQ